MQGQFSTTPQRSQRMNFTPEQRALLITAIEEKYYPTDDTIQQLANDFHISCHQIRIWFCNRRQQMRRNKIRAKFQDLKSPKDSTLSLPPENLNPNLEHSHPTLEEPTFLPSPEHLNQRISQSNPPLQRHKPDDPSDDDILPSISSIFPDIINKNDISATPFVSSSVQTSTRRPKQMPYSLPPITSLLQSIPLTPPTKNYNYSFPMPK
ncbi:uncharacterized protein C8R40DRAFT_1090041 [Lentinula edodes]|uniref:uncharacterized protein n=1 Tax=Lentinula edodes TaxID=5353 RepID=UPI001E8D845A|nr:uncharacterized protein C8R40DRAFT_1090041 [Lentinula edodes]KAH7878534.1 hypothetical protein C8R40DRAFT_1090041 [Lentinula edodes]